MRKRVYITSTSNLIIDNRVDKMANHISSKGLDVILIGRNFPNQKMVFEKKTYEILIFNTFFKTGKFFYLCYNLRLFLYLLFKKADYFLAIDLDTLLACHCAGRLKNVPVIFDSHEYFTELPEVVNRPFTKKMWKLVQDTVVPKVCGAITVSQGVAELYRKEYNKDFLLIRNVPNKNSSEFYPIRTVSKNPIVYYQGALNVGRGLEESIEAMKYLPNYKLVIVGGGDVENELKELTKKLDVEKQVEFVGVVPYQKLSEYASKADVGLCLLHNLGLNYYYSLPNRLFDYPKMGLPILATAFPDIKSFIDEYKTGVYVDGLDPKDIADKIRFMCEDESFREEVGNNLKNVSENICWEEEVKKMDYLFE